MAKKKGNVYGQVIVYEKKFKGTSIGKNPKRVSASVRQIVLERVREHSQKPDCVRDRIVELCGDLPRIELFARQKVKGWDYWGDQV